MNQALQIFNYIWQKILNALFETFDIGGGIKIGWIVITVGIMSAIIKTILPQVQGVIREETVKESKEK